MEGKDTRKELRGARARRTLGRNIGAVAEMAARGLLSPEEARDLYARLDQEFQKLRRQGKLTAYQTAKVEEDLIFAGFRTVQAPAG
ncbi:MAG: hypothetical protein ACI4Q3_00765 [Kiritimatiellia bacterium]